VSEHLQADGQGSTGLFQSANYLQLSPVGLLIGMHLAHENQSTFGEIFDYISQG
jgi:hypothetical protein